MDRDERLFAQWWSQPGGRPPALADVVDWIRIHLEPGEVYDDEALAEWAELNGWRKEEEE